MEIKLLTFGQLAEITGATFTNIPFQQDTESLVTWLKSQFPTLQSRSFIIAVNEQMVNSNTPLKSGDTVALLPPFSGG